MTPAKPIAGAAPAEGQVVVLAKVVSAHGITGEVRLRCFAEDPESLRHYPRFDCRGGRGEQGSSPLTLKALHLAGKDRLLARFAEVTDRTGAEALVGGELTVPREALPPLAQDEIYWHDLVGRKIWLADGSPAGVVRHVENYGASDILEIERPDGKQVLVPFIPAAVHFTADGEGLVVGAEWLL